jgi:hypothetical protein
MGYAPFSTAPISTHYSLDILVFLQKALGQPPLLRKTRAFHPNIRIHKVNELSTARYGIQSLAGFRASKCTG